MVYKFQNIHGITYFIDGNIKNINEELQELILKIQEDKKSPFSSVYVKLPIFLMNKFTIALESSDLKFKSVNKKKDELLIEF